ncbi:LytR family transcriptional regulator [Streptomyces sp. R302]|uniref:LCP family protein n=1 Tax=unclassified Streptomyces TaxID=2593676 RepID=UPI00145D6FBB|nr:MULTISPECIES: LCP family protein [unclassified Streptomyces]NML51135.1 LytR family transcriptional regulator [Streptomyces sp. R301]NML79713.1 LytR family transcriptional regulator [Streptomyces sp. R302]
MSQDTRTPEAVGGRRGAATPRKRRRTGRIVLLTLLVLLLAAGGTLYWLYSSIDGNIKAVDIDKALGDDRPAKLPTSGQNLLVLGSDSRAGDNGDLVGGAVGGGRADTTLVVHIPEGRTEAVAVSIPRDTLVTRPECVGRDGGTVPSKKRVMFNSIYAQYGSACVAKTVESMSGVRLDHFMEIDFSGFKDLVDTIGGVTVDVKQPIDDKQSGLHLEAGKQKLDGTQSLAFVRTRHGVGDGSDLGRISLQQQFLTSLLAEVKNQDLLGSPAKSYKIADSATKALTTDSELASLTALSDFGRSLNGVDPQNMETIMLPVAYDTIDPNRVVAYEPNSSRLWKAIREDAEIPADAKKSPATGG